MAGCGWVERFLIGRCVDIFGLLKWIFLMYIVSSICYDGFVFGIRYNLGRFFGQFLRSSVCSVVRQTRFV